jgi:hypothetical protein
VIRRKTSKKIFLPPLSFEPRSLWTNDYHPDQHSHVAFPTKKKLESKAKAAWFFEKAI